MQKYLFRAKFVFELISSFPALKWDKNIFHGYSEISLKVSVQPMITESPACCFPVLGFEDIIKPGIMSSLNPAWLENPVKH